MKNKINRSNIVLVNIQIVLTIASGVAFVMYLFNKDMWYILQFTLGFTLLFLAFMNYKVFEKKRFSILYLGVGFLLIVFNILSLVGVF